MNRYRVILFLSVFLMMSGLLFADVRFSPIAPRLEMSDALPLPRGEQIYQRGPRVAYGNGVFLVVWQEGYNGLGWDSNIMACRFSPDGRRLDETPITVCADPSVQEGPAVAFCNGQFLVVWADFRNGRDYDCYAARVDTAGTVTPRDGFLLAGGDRAQRGPAISSDNTDTFLVVWPDRRDNGPGVYGTRVSAGDGRALDGDGIRLMKSARQPAITFMDGSYFISLGRSACIVKGDLSVVKDLAELWSDRKRSPGAAVNAWGKFFAVFNTSPVPSPWGWASNGAIIGISVTGDGTSPEFGATKHGWYDLANNQADRKVKNVIDAARWRNHNSWPMGMPGGFKGSHDGTWPAGRSAAVWNGRSMIVAWTRARFVGKHKLGIRDIYLKRVLDNWAYVDEPRLKIVSGKTDEALPDCAADSEGNAILTYECQQSEGGIAAGVRVIREAEDTAPPRVAYIARRSPTEMIVAFDEPIDPGSVTTEKFSIKDVKVVSAEFRDYHPALMRQVVLKTGSQEAGRSYVMTISGVRDMSSGKNAMDGATFSYVCKPGVSEDSDFIVRWNVLGPFPNNWDVNFVDPENVHPSPGDSVKQRPMDELIQSLRTIVPDEKWEKDNWDTICRDQFSGERSWQVLETIYTSVLKLNKQYGKLKQAAVYLNTYVYSDREREVILRVDSNDGNRAWLNGRLIASHQATPSRGFHDRTDETPIKLNAGWNQLLLQSENKFGHWAVATQFTDRDRQPIRDLTYQMENPFGP